MSKKGKHNSQNSPTSDGYDSDAESAEPTWTYQSRNKQKNWLVVGVIVVLIGIVAFLGYRVSTVKSELTSTAKAKETAVASLDDAIKNLQKANESHTAEKAQYEESKQALEEQIASLETTLRNVKAKVGDLKDAKREAQKELSQFKAFSRQFKRMIASGKLEVDFRQGRMVVNLPAQVLFDSGSAELTEDGLAALREVAKVLRTVKNKRFVVGGHTDNQKIKKSSFESNWELASARAIIVTKSLVKAGLSPKNLIAAGYSQYAPIASNATEAGRQKNRRIEIILEPFLREIPAPSKKSKSTASNAKSKAKKKKKAAV